MCLYCLVYEWEIEREKEEWTWYTHTQKMYVQKGSFNVLRTNVSWGEQCDDNV